MLPGVRRHFQKSRRLDRWKRRQLQIAQALDELRKFGYRVFHDLRRDGHHLDHVIVGPSGVFAIETTFQSDEADDESERAVGKKSSRKSARENTVKVNRIVKENCEFDGWIWPLVVIAGEWRVKNDLATVGARLFTRNTLVSHIVNQRSRLTSTEVKLIASHLERSSKLIVRFRKKESEDDAL
jgi:hypothetical protein